ncbi:hypothetical protein ZWY2020_049796 [Hordeum vulgare]|nr:hypothetical protein ZWY2020_049796 [Hordeum vulgare]
MEDVEGMLRGLKLTTAEKKGLKVGEEEKGKAPGWEQEEPQAVGKLFSEKLVHARVIGHTMGRIWCPIKGLRCSELEENIFLFTFKQASGWRRALEDGPWWFDKELLVMEEFDPDKMVDEYEFSFIPMWIRVYGLPVGSMNRAMGEKIGKDFAKILDVDVGYDGKAIGKFLRIKVKLSINVPLMRGFVLDRERDNEQMIEEESHQNNTKKKKLRWCRFEYEHLPDFCYTCGIIGHRDKECKMKLAKNEAPQFGPWMRAEDENKKPAEGARGKWMGSRSSEDNMGALGYGQGGTERRPYQLGRGGSGRGSAALSWRKDGTTSHSSGRSSREEEREVTSPLKAVAKDNGSGSKGTSKQLSFDDKEKGGSRQENEGTNLVMVSSGEEITSMENQPHSMEKDRREKENAKIEVAVEGRGKIISGKRRRRVDISSKGE